MRVLVLLAAIFAFAMPASADISDNGNLTIGGQMIIGGTMTVQGSAFSVGGSTLVVDSGSVTVAAPATFSSTTTFAFSPSSTTIPTPNALYSMFIPAAAVIFGNVTTSSITTYGAINVKSVTKLSTGDFRVTFAKAMSGVHYACLCTSPSSGASVCSFDSSPSPSPNNIDVLLQGWNSTTFVNQNPAFQIMVMCWDYGNKAQ